MPTIPYHQVHKVKEEEDDVYDEEEEKKSFVYNINLR